MLFIKFLEIVRAEYNFNFYWFDFDFVARSGKTATLRFLKFMNS